MVIHQPDISNDIARSVISGASNNVKVTRPKLKRSRKPVNHTWKFTKYAKWKSKCPIIPDSHQPISSPGVFVNSIWWLQQYCMRPYSVRYNLTDEIGHDQIVSCEDILNIQHHLNSDSIAKHSMTCRIHEILYCYWNPNPFRKRLSRLVCLMMTFCL